MSIKLDGLCRGCSNEKCRRWLVRNLNGIEGKLQVTHCEFFIPEKKEAG